MKFQVYTYFGRILADFVTLEEAREFCKNYHGTTWLRLVR